MADTTGLNQTPFFRPSRGRLTRALTGSYAPDMTARDDGG